jgi:hypothetical protein
VFNGKERTLENQGTTYALLTLSYIFVSLLEKLKDYKKLRCTFVSLLSA